MAQSTTDFGTALQNAIAGGYVAQLTGQTYVVTSPIVIHIDSTIQGPLGIDGGGATLISQITNGAPVIEIDVGPGVDLRYLDLSNFTVQGNGQEGDGIKIVAAGNDRWVYNWNINNVTVEHVGGYGLDVQGSVFEGLVSNSWMNDNGQGGAYFSHLDGGQASALRWFGGGADDNGGAGITLDNGARDMSVDGASFQDNGGVGISAAWGITSVSSSDFNNNHGAGIDFENYGNFNHDTFESSGAQSVGISGYLANDATLIGNTATGPEALADIQGQGGSLQIDNIGPISDGPSVTVGGAGSGDLAHVTVSDVGVAAPVVSAVTAATTAAIASSNGTGALETAIEQGLAGHTVHIADAAYTVTAPIVINVASSSSNGVIDLGGAKITSNIEGGGPVIEVVVGAGVTLNNLTLENFSINGNGGEGDGVKIVADGTDRAIANLTISNVNVEHTGGVGLDVLGNVSHVNVADSWMNGNALGGARFADSAHGGTASDLDWIGGGFRKNGGAGMILDNGTHDMSVKGAYFVENLGPGIYASSGITLVQASGFENNGGEGAYIQGASNFTDDTFSTWGPQAVAVAGSLAAGAQVSMTGTDFEYYGSGSDPTVLANLQGDGSLAVTGGGPIVAGSGISVVGGNPTLASSVGMNTGDGTVNTTAPIVTETLSGTTSTTASVTGTADAGATVNFAIDGSTIGATATADANGAWSFTTGVLGTGSHTIVATETNAAGLTGSAAVGFTIAPSPPGPVLTAQLAQDTGSSASDAITSNASLTGTADANATVHFTIDGQAVAATAVADAGGHWSFTPAGLADGPHTIVASETNAVGLTGSAVATYTLETAAPLPFFTGGTVSSGMVTLTGFTGQANDRISVYDGNSWMGFATTAADGTFTISGKISDGVHSYGANATDLAGNESHGANAYIVSTLSPHVSAMLLEDTGASATDGITSKATLTGTTDSLATVHFTVDGAAIAATTQADSSGNWTFTPTGLADGAHTIVASESNAAGVTATTTESFTFDTTAPVVTETAGSNGAVSGTGDANATVHFTIDGTVSTATATADANGAWSFAPTGLAAGTHAIVATEIDAAGNTGSASMSLSVGAHSPTTPIFTGATEDSSGTVTLSGSTGEVGDNISIYDGNSWIGGTTTDANGNWTYVDHAAAGAAHSFGYNATFLSGSMSHSDGKALIGGSADTTLTGAAGSDLIDAHGGNDTVVGGGGADTLIAGSGHVSFQYTAVADSTPTASDTISGYQHGVDQIDFSSIAGITATSGLAQYQGALSGTGNLTLNAHSVATMEVGGNTMVLVNATANAETVSATDTHAANMEITLVGVHLGLTGSDFHHQ
jgi:hypothetical protein